MKTLLVALLLSQQICGERLDLFDQLLRQYGERPVMSGLNRSSNVIEILVGPYRTWTIVVTRPDGLSCIVDHGSHIEALAGPPGRTL